MHIILTFDKPRCVYGDRRGGVGVEVRVRFWELLIRTGKKKLGTNLLVPTECNCSAAPVKCIGVLSPSVVFFFKGYVDSAVVVRATARVYGQVF